MIRNLQRLPLAQRRLVFFLILIGAIMLLVLVTLLLIGQSLNSGRRDLSVALVPEVSVREFAVLPDNDAYPPAVAAAPDGTVYTGSYATGAIWAIDAAGTVRELPNTRETIGAVTGLTTIPDGTLLVVDQLDTDPRTRGGRIYQIAPDGTISPFGTTDGDIDFIAPNDITLDSAGAVYVTDSGRNEVLRFVPAADGTVAAESWWAVPTQTGSTRSALTGIAYDATTDAIVVTDPELNRIYRIPVATVQGEIVYEHGERANAPGFDGITVGPDGTLYVAALAQNGVAIVQDNDLDYIAGLFRGSSDVEYAAPGLLYVPNFDQTPLVIPLIQPRLPFAIDVITLNTFEATPAVES